MKIYSLVLVILVLAISSAVLAAGKTAEDWTNEGIALKLSKNYEKALAAFEKAVELDPQYIDAWVGMSGTLGKLHRYKEGLTAADKALAIDRKNELAWVQKAAHLGSLKRYQEALAAAEEALKLDPKDSTMIKFKSVVKNYL
jgi:tetratricopeptide (TPR) repeat protein